MKPGDLLKANPAFFDFSKTRPHNVQDWAAYHERNTPKPVIESRLAEFEKLRAASLRRHYHLEMKP